MFNVKVYTTDYCPFCNAAKNLLNEKGIPFEEVKLTDRDELQALKDKTNFNTVPQIFFGENMIGGFDELRALDQDGKLDGPEAILKL